MVTGAYQIRQKWSIAMWIQRAITPRLMGTLARGKSILLFGPRQTGKTSLVTRLKYDLYINLMRAAVLQKYEIDIDSLFREIDALKKSIGRKPLIIIDEVQKLPQITDTIQLLIDNNIAQFILTGSSARKIKNLLPGRVIKYTLSPLMLNEINDQDLDIKILLENGSLPEIFSMHEQNEIEELLGSYVNLYIEEEVRKEALVRNIANFSNFLQLACIESGNTVNLRSIGSEIGVTHNTITEYYRILQDCMLIETIEPLTKSITRKRLTKAPKYLLYDLGVRRVGAGESLNSSMRSLAFNFEQFIGLELCRITRHHTPKIKVLYWRSHDGPEVDYVLEMTGQYIPIEVKWTERPNTKDIKHLLTFMAEYKVTQAYIICRCSLPQLLAPNILALPWNKLPDIFNMISEIN